MIETEYSELEQRVQQKTLESKSLLQREKQLQSLQKRVVEDLRKAEQNIRKKQGEQSQNQDRQKAMKKEQLYIDDRIRAFQLSIDEERKRMHRYQQTKNTIQALGATSSAALYLRGTRLKRHKGVAAPPPPLPGHWRAPFSLFDGADDAM